jgi:hypothetical protein
LRDGIVQTEDCRLSQRRGGRWSAALTCLVIAVFCVGTFQLPARSNQAQPRQLEEEETHESNVKESRATNTAKLKVPRHSRLLLPLSEAEPDVFLPPNGRYLDVGDCWNAHSYRRRGPPPSFLLS